MSVYIPAKVPPALHKKVSGIIGDVSKFAQLHKIQDKDTKCPVQWNSSPMQDKIFEAVKQGHNRIIIGKARQVYATTGCKMVLNQMAWFVLDNPKVKNPDLQFALETAQQAVDANKGDSSVIDTLARAYWETGNKAKAIEWQKKAVEKVAKEAAEDDDEEEEEEEESKAEDIQEDE